MPETLGVLGVVITMLILATVVATGQPLSLLWLTLGVAALSLLAGVPAGVIYHLRLRQALLRRGPLPGDFYKRPHAHHADLDDAELARILPPFYVGAWGFGLFMLAALTAVVVLATHFV